MSHNAALSQNLCKPSLSPESRQRLLRTVHSALELLQSYDGLADVTPDIRKILVTRLLAAVAELDALAEERTQN